MGVEIFIYVFFAVGLAVLAYYSYVNRCKWFKWDCPSPSPSPSTLLQSGPSPSPSPSTYTYPPGKILSRSNNSGIVLPYDQKVQVLTPTTLVSNNALYSFVDDNKGNLTSVKYTGGGIDLITPKNFDSVTYSPTTGGVMNATSISFNYAGGDPPIIFS